MGCGPQNKIKKFASTCSDASILQIFAIGTKDWAVSKHTAQLNWGEMSLQWGMVSGKEEERSSHTTGFFPSEQELKCDLKKIKNAKNVMTIPAMSS